jgi:transposase-like protein
VNSGGENQRYLNVRETAKLLGVHENTIRNWVKAGMLVSSRLPGAAGHRFAHSEVLRLQRERGATTSSIAPALRTDGPELVRANDLNSWASRLDAKGTFPELMRRLLAMTPGITNLEIRAHEGIAASGWDGTATSTGSAFLPPGELRFEFGTDQRPKGKAQDDYDKRANALPADTGSIFVFATPRNWPGAKGWANERERDKKFAGVKAIEAHVLEGWLEHTPSVHYWISERLGYRPSGAQTVEQWWAGFRDGTDPKLPAEFFLAGRSQEAEIFRSLLRSGDPTGLPAVIQAASKEDALAFIFAALDTEEDLLPRTLVVTEESAWYRLAGSTSPLILVADFDGKPGTDRLSSSGHRVVYIAKTDDIVRNAIKVELPKVDRIAAADALRAATVNEQGVSHLQSNEIDQLVAMARRSVPAFLRSIAVGGRMRLPDWATNHELLAILAPLILLGSWAESPRDLETVRKLTDKDPAVVERLLASIAVRPDAPFVWSAGEWRLASPEEAAQILLPTLTNADLDRWQEVAKEVLLEPDPFRGMDTVARLTASAVSAPPTFSQTIRKGVSRSLALVATVGNDLPRIQARDVVNRIVRDVLNSANDDPSGASWERLSPVLSELAEAAPDIFMAAVETDLDRPDPILQTLFQDSQGVAILGPSSPHAGLLWALETLCWSPAHFGAAAGLLGRLATVDPGGRLSNRPLESLQKVTLGWISQSGALVDDKITVIRHLLESHPDAGWKLLMGVWPAHHSTSFPPSSPIYRDWTPASRGVSMQEWGQYVTNLVDLALAAAVDSASHWQLLLPQLAPLPPAERERLLSGLARAAASPTWTDEERIAVWEALIKEADKHEQFSEAPWAMSGNEVFTLRSIASGLESTGDARRFSLLFDWTPRVPGLTRGDPKYAETVDELRTTALQEVLNSGAKALDLLVLDVEMPHAIGFLLAALEDTPEQHVLEWLGSTQEKLRSAAMSFAGAKIARDGIEWLNTVLASPALHDPDRSELLMGCVPFEKRFWDKISMLGAPLQAAYWARVNVFRVPDDERQEAAALLLENGRAWDAVATLANALHITKQLDAAAAKNALNHLLESTQPMPDPVMSSYYVAQLLEHLEAVTPDDPDLVRHEFTFFELLHDHRPSEALYRALSRDPQEFVNLVCAVYRAEGEPRRTGTAQENARARLAFSVLRNWRTVPGQSGDGSIDARHLTEWVRSARLALSDCGRAPIGDEQIGAVLSASPPGLDGVWPAEPVRDLIETIGNQRIDTGFHIGKANRRGITSRGVFDGGAQERELERQYQALADRIATRWPRTARILRGIAEDYGREAKRNDAEAERLADEG